MSLGTGVITLSWRTRDKWTRTLFSRTVRDFLFYRRRTDFIVDSKVEQLLEVLSVQPNYPLVPLIHHR